MASCLISVALRTVVANRKPHLLRIKKDIVSFLDERINSLIKEGAEARDIAIWIRQRNKFARDAEVALIELTMKDGQGQFVYKVEG